ncbi:sulfotransferase [Sphingomonas sp. QA11]|uniref:tetratricopeptide repeat-containing sulfotransferase family protein n=1 Tax=Sphingomonas sp. QA11 TaxID=2950605 RepID=UPI0023497091|nr:tetratricopeptide repeat-containing sulfotransferase family protein [Sphingomonas sp. QA11]WCM28026.1 sulfotransferase [Sphingomonas sp. QA11]
MSVLLEREPAPADTGMCVCGSGLRQPRCCGLDLRQIEPEAAEPPPADQLAALKRAYQDGDLAAVRRIAIGILDVSPGQREALGMLFNLLKEGGELEAAGMIADRLARLHHNDAVSRMIAAQFFLARNDMPRAQLHSRMLVRLAPEAPVSHFTMGAAFLAQGNGQAAEHHLRIALRLPPSRGPRISMAEVEANLALALRHQGRFDEAREIFARLTEANGPNLTVLLSWAGLEESAQQFETAAGLLDRALTLAPGNPRASVARAALYRRTRQPERALDALQPVTGPSVEEGVEGAGLLQKGQILDSMGRYDEAFTAFDAFKRQLRERSGHSYRAEHAERLVTALRDFFTEGRSPLLPRAEIRGDSPQPIFIIGFPRSGTTLVEQTLTSHPNVSAGDELPIIGSIAERSQMLLGSPGHYPISLSELWLGDRVGHIQTLRDLYLNEAARFGAVDPSRRWFTDKMPLNETHLGLISLLFPASPVIHLVRHPLDVVLSAFSNGLTHGFYCAYALETAARHYALIADLIAHYRAAMPINYHAVRYEDLVVDQERQVRSLFDFIGEPFDPKTLDFHTNARPARTASYAQVTEKLYERSRYRYRNYLKHLQPVIPILQPSIDRLGYVIEE